MKLSIILPTYNESGNIADLMQAIETAISPEGWETELIVVDDNSPDGTAEVVRAYEAGLASRQANMFQVRCEVRQEEHGLATAILHGLRLAKGEILVVMDTDFNHDPNMIPQMVKFLEFYDLLIGSRFVMGGGMEDRQRYYYSLAYNLFVRLLLWTQVQDNLSGFLAMRRENLQLLDTTSIFRGYGEYFIRLLYNARRLKFRMLEVPVFYILRRHGQSKSRFLHMLKDYSICVLGIWAKHGPVR